MFYSILKRNKILITYSIFNLLIELRSDESSEISNTQLYILIHKNTTMLIISRSVLRACSNVPSMCQPFIKKYSKDNKIKRLMKEYKLVFGPLIETKTQKKRRLKLEKKGVIPQEETNTTNTELSWVMENSRTKLKKISLTAEPQKERSSDKDQSSINKFNEIEDPTDQSTNNHFHSDSNQTAQEMGLKFNTTSNVSAKDSNKEVANTSVSDIENASTKYTSSNLERLPDIVIKNLLSFPLISSKQEFPAQSNEVLSISRKDDLETVNFPSVTKILTQTMSPESKLALEAWKERMIKKLGQEGFEIHQKGI